MSEKKVIFKKYLLFFLQSFTPVWCGSTIERQYRSFSSYSSVFWMKFRVSVTDHEIIKSDEQWKWHRLCRHLCEMSRTAFHLHITVFSHLSGAPLWLVNSDPISVLCRSQFFCAEINRRDTNDHRICVGSLWDVLWNVQCNPECDRFSRYHCSSCIVPHPREQLVSS